MRLDTLAFAFAFAALTHDPLLAQTTPPSNGDDVEAARLFHEAETRYASGDVVGALECMQRSHGLSGRSELLFNLGELNRELGRCSEARDAYSRYLEALPEARFRDRATRALALLTPQCPVPEMGTTGLQLGPRRPASEARSPVVDLEERYWTAPRVAGWSLVGAGLSAAALSVYFGVKARAAEADIERAVKEDRARPLDEKRAWEELAGEANVEGPRAATLAYVFGAGAGACAVSGLALLLFTGKHGSERDLARESVVSFGVAPDSVRGSLRVAF